MKAGDVIVSIAGEKVSAPAEITSVLRAKSSSQDGLALGIVRNQKKLTLTITPSGDWTEGRFFPDDRGSQWSRK
jgi:S1-C subfamily serine protease